MRGRVEHDVTLCAGLGQDEKPAMEATRSWTLGRVLRYGLPVAVMAVAPLFAWVVLAIPAIAIQWRIEPHDRIPLTSLYALVVALSLTCYIASRVLAPI